MTAPSKPKVAIIGCGLIGQAWAIVFAKAGHTVALYDAEKGVAAEAVNAIKRQVDALARHGLVDAEHRTTIVEAIATADDLSAALAEAIYVQENGPERVDVKAALTAEIDALVPDGVPIGSSTSGIPASAYAANVAGRQRCLVVHPINPPHLIPAVEVVPTPFTHASATHAVMDLMAQVGQVPILLQREVTGFVVNRLQGALLAEAFRLVGSGVASAGDVDAAIRDGLGLRWALMGPFETIHLNAPQGIAQYVERYGPMYRAEFASDEPLDDWAAIVENEIGAVMLGKHPLPAIAGAQKVRDTKLMALRRHLDQADDD